MFIKKLSFASLLAGVVSCSFVFATVQANGEELNKAKTISPIEAELVAVAKTSGFRYGSAAPITQPRAEDIATPKPKKLVVLHFEGSYGLNNRYPGTAWFADGKWHFRGGMPPHLEKNRQSSVNTASYEPYQPISHPTRYVPRPVPRKRAHHSRH